MDQAKLLKLIDEALDTAHTAGMEQAAEMEGTSWTGNGTEKADLAAGDARQILLDALGIEVVPVYDKLGGGSVVGSAVVVKDGTTTITLNNSPEADAILDKIKGPHHGHPGFGISSKGNPLLKGHQGKSSLSTGPVRMSGEEFSERLKAPEALNFKEIFTPEEEK